MRLSFAIISLLLSALMPLSASACIGREAEELIFTKRPPSTALKGMEVLEVKVPADEQVTGYPVVEVITPPDDIFYSLHKKRLIINPGIWSSCMRWGVTGGRAFVMGMVGLDEQGRLFMLVHPRLRREGASE